VFRPILQADLTVKEKLRGQNQRKEPIMIQSSPSSSSEWDSDESAHQPNQEAESPESTNASLFECTTNMDQSTVPPCPLQQSKYADRLSAAETGDSFQLSKFTIFSTTPILLNQIVDRMNLMDSMDTYG